MKKNDNDNKHFNIKTYLSLSLFALDFVFSLDFKGATGEKSHKGR